MITDAAMEGALEKLAETDEDFGRLAADVRIYEDKLKQLEALQFIVSRERTVEGKKADARSTKTYIDTSMHLETLRRDYETLKAQRTTYATLIDVWRTQSYAKGKGIIY